MILSISGKKQHGKDTFCTMAQFIIMHENLKSSHVKLVKAKDNEDPLFHYNIFANWSDKEKAAHCGWERRQFAGKLKEIACMLLGCNMAELENPTFKESPLGPEWDIWRGAFTENEKLIHIVFQTEAEAIKALDEVESGTKTKWHTVWKTRLTPRKFMQLLGTNCGRDIIHPNIWVNATMVDYKSLGKTSNHAYRHGAGWRFMNAPHVKDELRGMYTEDTSSVHFFDVMPNWFITDVRFENEVNAVFAKEGKVIRIFNPRVSAIDRHESEIALDNYQKFDYYITNDGSLEDLFNKTRECLEHFKII